MRKYFLIFVIVFCQLFYSSNKDTTIIFYFGSLKVPVQINFCSNSKGCILALPGWNLKATDWCTKTSLCEKANARRYNVVMVEMQKSVYLKEYYPQTKNTYKTFPTRSWLYDSVLTYLYDKKIISSYEPMFVLGLSTGGRGAAIMALEYPNLFKAAASLSGDFDPLLQKNDALMINSIGTYEKYSKLWKGDNNMSMRAAEFKTPIYIGHGCADKICPVIQSKSFVKALRSKNPKLKVSEHFPKNMQHDYKYWDSEVDAMLKFFDETFSQ